MLGAALTGLLTGCGTPPAPHPEGRPRNYQAEVVAEFERSVAGWNAGQLDKFLSIYAEDATFAFRDRFLHGLAEIRNYYAPQFGPGGVRGHLTFDEFNVEVLSLDVILIRALYRSERAGETLTGTSTLILRYQSSHWQIIHDHST